MERFMKGRKERKERRKKGKKEGWKEEIKKKEKNWQQEVQVNILVLFKIWVHTAKHFIFLMLNWRSDELEHICWFWLPLTNPFFCRVLCCNPRY